MTHNVPFSGNKSKKGSPSIWAVIVHWQGKEDTKACIESLKNLNYPNLHVLLVDNDSPDQSGLEIVSQFSNIHLLKTDKNLGFAGGSNIGFDFCLRNDADWIWLLNNDTKIDPNCLQILITAAKNNPQAGALGAQVLHKENGQLIATSGPGAIDFVRAKTYLKSRKDSNQSNSASITNCSWLEGSNLLLKAEALKQTNGFDERYFLYFEDVDLCLRLQKLNWQCLFVPEAKIEHLGSASTTGERKYWRAYYHTRNRLLFFFTYGSLWTKLPQTFYIIGHLIRHALVLPFRGEDGRKKLKAEMLGLRDYLSCNFGQAKCLDWCS